jgi:RNA polymerase sigma-70 factor (ECF subfamily)
MEGQHLLVEQGAREERAAAAVAPNAEIELLEAARAGDGAAQQELYERYFAKNRQVQGLLAREVRNPADREDVMHDAYMSLVRSSAEFRGDSRLHTFIYRVVQFTILQKLRKERSAREDRMVRLTVEVDGEERDRELAAVDYQFEEVDAGATAAKLLRMLPAVLETAFRMRVMDEMSYEEIAAATGAPLNTVATRIFKARKLLGEKFGLARG